MVASTGSRPSSLRDSAPPGTFFSSSSSRQVTERTESSVYPSLTPSPTILSWLIQLIPPTRAAPTINPHRSFMSASLVFCCCRRRCCCCCYTAVPPPPPPPAVVVPFWWGVRQLIDAPREHLMSTRPPPARHHGENMSRVAARTRPGSILSLWRSGMEIIKQPFISSNCTLLS